MGVYKVLKDFPSRNGVKQYEAGTSVQLDDNSRTKALIEMGFIEKDTDSYAREDAKIIATPSRLLRQQYKLYLWPLTLITR